MTPEIQTDWSGTALAITLRGRSRTIHFHPYAAPLGDRSVLAWVLDRLRSAMDPHLPIYLVADRRDRERLEQDPDLGALGAIVWPSSGLGEAGDLQRLAAAAGLRTLLLTDLTAALLPRKLFAVLLRQHRRGADATLLGDVPCAACPLLVETAILSKLPPPPSGRTDAVRAGLELLVAREPDAVRFRCITPITQEEQARRRWPVRPGFDLQEDVETLREVVRRAEGVQGDPDLLHIWNAVLASHHGESRSFTLATRSTPVRRSTAARQRTILIASNPSAMSGGEEVMIVLAEAIRAQASDRYCCAALVAQPGVFTDRLAAAGVDVIIGNQNFAQERAEHYLFASHVLDDVRPALVHANSVIGLPFCCAVLEKRIPMIQHTHVVGKALTSLAEQIRIASHVIAVSSFVKGQVTRQGIDPARVHVVPNGIRMENADAVRADGGVRQALGLSPTTKILLIPARIAANKRHDLVIAALDLVRRQIPDVHLVCAGEVHAEGSVADALHRQVHALGLDAHVTFQGFVADIGALYRAADVLTLPSENDPLPLVVMEAMAAGVPVVAARSGGIPEMIEHEVSGLLVTPGRADELAAAIVRTLTEPALTETMTRTARAACRARFTMTRFAADVLDLYDRILAAAEPRTASVVTA